MVSLQNSQRFLLKATYVPTNAPASQPAQTSRTVEKVAMIRQLNLQAAELVTLAKNEKVTGLKVDLTTAKNIPFEDKNVALLDVVKPLVSNISSGSTKKYAPMLMHFSLDQINTFGQAVAAQRQAAAKVATTALTDIRDTFQLANPKASINDAAAIKFALKKQSPSLLQLQKIAVEHMSGTALNLMAAPQTAVDLVSGISSAAASALNVVNGFLDRFKVEPVGRLHLERIEMTPVGIEHGELVHSVPLTPQETVNISHREWSTTTQTFENIVSDSFTGFSEQGVTDKTDIAQATTNESRQQSSMDVNGNVSASYSGAGFSVTASTGIDYNTHSDDFKSVKDSLAHSVAVTRSASARTRKDHRTSFRVSSVAGTEDLAVQVLTNPTANAIRVDYYQLMRKWRVDLIRYGLRMTYDIVVPNPGNDLAQKVMALYVLNQQIAVGYQFNLHIADITVDNWMDYEQAYGVTLDSPPADPFEAMQTGTFVTSIDKFTFGPIEIDLPDDYAVTGGHFHAQVHIGDGDYGSNHRAQVNLTGENAGAGTSPRDAGGQFQAKDGVLEVDLTTNTVVGRVGKVSLMYNYYNVESGGFVLSVQASPTKESIGAWQAKVWGQIRDADIAAYNANLTLLTNQKTTLQAELDLFDALTLRRMEREEIMKSVLQWLFGPSFQLQPGALDELLTNPQDVIFAAGDNDAWQTVLQYGEFIKYIHNAIEWENVLYFPYPYFWDSTQRWPFKLFLVHPDPEHRSFLRAGCARVVLTIRPGFEQSFAQFMETYSLDTILASNHPYVSIGNEIRNFAMTNYEAIPPANPDKNVRPLLFPEQRKAWSDMQKIILLIEAYNTGKHTTTLTAAIAGPGSQQVIPVSMLGIEYGTTLTIDTDNNQETVTVTATTNASFTATFLQAHPVGVAVLIDADVKLYPTALNDLAAFTGGTPLPLTDPWGAPFIYQCPGIHGDYDLSSLGKDGLVGGDDLDADITSWAEGSVVSTWFEYTPTSALDVVINSNLTTVAVPA